MTVRKTARLLTAVPVVASLVCASAKFRASAVQWTGKSWGPATLFHAGTAFNSVIAAAPADVWAFRRPPSW
jgi:hypothetical protein